MKFPTLVYKTPGSHDYKGGTFEYKGVDTEAELVHFIADGWFLSLPEAIAGYHDESKLENLTLETPDAPPAIKRVPDPIIAQFDQVQIPSGVVVKTEEQPLDKSGGTPIDQPGGPSDVHVEQVNEGDEDSTDTSVQDGMTRAELKAKAKELGIDFDGRASNAELARLISERQQGV